MGGIFLIKLLLSFLIGGAFAICVTIIADKYGSKIGGIIGGLPSTALFGLLFIALTQNPQKAVEATTIIPAAFGMSVIFLASFAYFLKDNLWSSLAKAFIVYFILAMIFLIVHISSIALSLIIYTILLICSLVIFNKFINIEKISNKKITYTPQIILFRGLLTGAVVACVVLLAKFIGPVYGGIASAFPAVYTSSLIILFNSQGTAFAKAISRSFVFGTISIVLYALVVRYAYITFGVWFGTIVALFASVVCSFLVYKFILKRIN